MKITEKMSYERVLADLEHEHDIVLETMSHEHAPTWGNEFLTWVETVSAFCRLADERNTHASRSKWYKIPSVKAAIDVADEIVYTGFSYLDSDLEIVNDQLQVVVDPYGAFQNWIFAINPIYRRLHSVCSKAIRDTQASSNTADPQRDQRNLQSKVDELTSQVAALTAMLSKKSGCKATRFNQNVECSDEYEADEADDYSGYDSE